MELSPGLIAVSRQLSEAAVSFLRHLEAHPQSARELLEHRIAPPAFAAAYPYPVQPWPTFVDAAKLAAIRHATLEVNRLVRAVPARVFDNDPQRIAKFFGLGDPFIAALHLEPPTGLENALTRCDFVDSPAGFKCLEINTGAFLGGWQNRFWAEMCNANPVLRSFVGEHGLAPYFRDPLRELLRWVIEDVRRQGIADGPEINICLQTGEDRQATGDAGEYLDDVYAAVRAESAGGLAGRFISNSAPHLVQARGGKLYHGATRLHAIIEYVDRWTPEHVFRSFKLRQVALYNSPLAKALSDKRVLALLSSLADSDRFDAGERAAIRAHIPWSREVAAGPTTFEGGRVDLIELLLARRAEFVVKHGQGSGGRSVHVGRHVAAAAWEALVRQAAAAGGWLAQEHCGSLPYLYHQAGAGPTPHEMIWGLFAFGPVYGGCFLRMMPLDAGDGVINSARGATEGLMFEV